MTYILKRWIIDNIDHEFTNLTQSLLNNPSKKVLILDLDNTVFPVRSIGDELFRSVYQLIIENGEYKGDFNHIRLEIMRRPLLLVAKDFSFSERLTNECLALFEDMTYSKQIETFKDYPEIRKYPCKKYLVTTGFPKLQNSKIKQLGIETDFEGIYIVDPVNSNLTKKDIFQQIINDNSYPIKDVLVVGDDLNSEIKAGQELVIETILYDYRHEHATTEKLKVITDFKELGIYF